MVCMIIQTKAVNKEINKNVGESKVGNMSQIIIKIKILNYNSLK